MKNIVAGVLASAYMIVSVVPALASAPVAELSGLQGKVLVNHGKGYQPAVGSVVLNTGDLVMVGEKSSAKINYLNTKCLVSANASSVVMVTSVAPCKAGVVVGSVDAVFAVPAADADPSFIPPPAFPILPVLLGTAVVVGGGVLIFSRCRNSVSAC
jgi:hypothetical protein